MNMANENPFGLFTALGYGPRLLPIIPPGAPISPKSTIARRLATNDPNDDPRGKTPGIRWPDGSWSGFNWMGTTADTASCDRWRDMGAGVGIKTGDGLVGIDADITSVEHARAVESIITEHLGELPARIGRAPKVLYVCRVEGAFPYARIDCEIDGKKERVELLTEGRQFVAWGTHPRTLAPYRWPRPLPGWDELVVATPAQLEGMLEALRAVLPAASAVQREGAGPPVDQAALLGEPALLLEAIRRTPNTSKHFPEREDYLAWGYMTKAAFGPDLEDVALEAYQAWCARWEDGENDPEVVAADWARMKPPYRAGAAALLRTAEVASEGAFRAVPAKFHEPVAEPAPIYESIFKDEPKPETLAFHVVPASDLHDTPVPIQEWLVRDLIPARNVTLLAGDGGTGKSLITLQLGVAMASGGQWLGLDCAPGATLFCTAEDEMDELHRRLAAIGIAEKIELSTLSRLKLVSLNGMDAVLAAPDGREGLLKATAVMARLRATLEAVRPVLTVLDTSADMFGGDEIRRVQVRQFVGMLQGLANEYETTVVLLSHPSVAGIQSGTGTSGSTAWSNSVRSRLYLSRRQNPGDGSEDDPDLRVLTTKKTNRARAGGEMLVRWTAGRFVPWGDGTSLEEQDAAMETRRLFMALLAECEAEDTPVAPSQTARNYAPTVFSRRGNAKKKSRTALETAMQALLADGEIKVISYGPPSRRFSKIVKTPSQPSQPSHIPQGLFD